MRLEGCIATYRKGDAFLEECRRQGCRVLLLTEVKLGEADWPRHAIDGFYFVRRDMPEDDIRKGAAYLSRTERLDRIVALDDFDVETAAMLREYLHVPGMDATTARGLPDSTTCSTGASASSSTVVSSSAMAEKAVVLRTIAGLWEAISAFSSGLASGRCCATWPSPTRPWRKG